MSSTSRGKGAEALSQGRNPSLRFARGGSSGANDVNGEEPPSSPSARRKNNDGGTGSRLGARAAAAAGAAAGTAAAAALADEEWVSAALDYLNKEALPTVRAMRGLRTLEQPVKIALAGRLATPIEPDAALRGRPATHALVVGVEQQRTPSGAVTVATIYDLSVTQALNAGNSTSAGGGAAGPRALQVIVRRSWTLDRLSSVERPETESATFNLVFVSTKAAVAPAAANGTSAASQSFSNREFEAADPMVCDELLWGLLSLCKALLAEQPDTLNLSLKELDATAVYNGYANKHPVVQQLLRAKRGASSAVGGAATQSGASGGGGISGRGKEGAAGDAGGGVGAGGGSSTDWVYDEYAAGEAALDQLRWQEKGQEGLQEALAKEAEALESGTVEQLIVWSESSDGTRSLSTSLDALDAQLTIMQEWLDVVGRPLELMQRDMAAIEGKNNKLDVRWRNYRRLHEHLDFLVASIALSPDKEDVLRDPDAVLSAAGVEDEPSEAVGMVVASSASLQDALLAVRELEKEAEGGPPLAFLAEQQTRLSALREAFVAALALHLKRLLRRLASKDVQEDTEPQQQLASATSNGARGGAKTRLMDASSTTQRLLVAQRQFHSLLIDYEPLFQQIRSLEGPLLPPGELPPVGMPPGPNSQALHAAYAAELANGLLRSRIKQYFAELRPRIQFSRTSVSLANAERWRLDAPNGGVAAAHRSATGGAGSSGKREVIGAALAVREAMEQCMPAMAREHAFFATLFGLDPSASASDSDIVKRTLSTIFGELHTNFGRLAQDTTDAFDVLSILAFVDGVRETPAFQGQAHADLIGDFENVLLGKFGRFVQEQIAWIGTHQLTAAKRAGILAPFAKLPTLVARMQAAVITGRAAAVITPATPREGGGSGSSAGHRPASSRSSGIWAAESGETIAAAAAAFQKLANAAFQHLEAVAQRDPKYSHVVRLENCWFFSQALGPQRIACLQDAVAQADAGFATSSAAYLQWLASYQFPYLTQFFARIEDLVAKCGASDVAFHETKKALESALRKHGSEATIVEGLRATYSRLVKHLSRESGLLAVLWDRLSDTLFAMFSRYEELCALCYDFDMSPGAADVRRLATEVGGGGGGGNIEIAPSLASETGRSDAEETSPRSVGSASPTASTSSSMNRYRLDDSLRR